MYLSIKVIPRSKETSLISTLADGTLKIRLKATPEKGQANRELIAFLAKHYKVPKSGIKLISGSGTTHKLIKISNSN